MAVSTLPITADQIDVAWEQLSEVFTKYLDFDGPNGSFVFQLFYLNHSFVVANIVFRLFRQFPRKDSNGETQFPLVAGVLMMLVTGLGGAILNAILLGEQQVFLSQDIFLGYFLLAWALTIYSPFYLVHYITGNALVEFFTYLAEGYFVAQFLMNGVDKGVALFPGKNVAPIIIGTLSAIGGGEILRPFFSNLYFGYPKVKSGLSSPSLAGFIALASASSYLVGHHYGFAGSFSVSLTPNTTLVFTPRWIIRIVYILFFLLLWLRSSILSLFRRNVPQVPSKKSEPRPNFPMAGEKKIEEHIKPVTTDSDNVASKPKSRKKNKK